MKQILTILVALLIATNFSCTSGSSNSSDMSNSSSQTSTTGGGSSNSSDMSNSSSQTSTDPFIGSWTQTEDLWGHPVTSNPVRLRISKAQVSEARKGMYGDIFYTVEKDMGNGFKPFPLGNGQYKKESSRTLAFYTTSTWYITLGASDNFLREEGNWGTFKKDE